MPKKEKNQEEESRTSKKDDKLRVRIDRRKDKKHVNYDAAQQLQKATPTNPNETKASILKKPPQTVKNPSMFTAKSNEMEFVHVTIAGNTNLSGLDSRVNGLDVNAEIHPRQLKNVLSTLPKDHGEMTIYFSQDLKSEAINRMLTAIKEFERDSGQTFDKIYDFQAMAALKYKR